MSSEQHSSQEQVPAAIKAHEMAGAIRLVANALNGRQLLLPKSFSHLLDEAKRLDRLGSSVSWTIETGRENSIQFKASQPSPDSSGLAVEVNLLSTISVTQSQPDFPPFETLDIAIELRDPVGQLLGRWHVDRANSSGGEVQDGPLFHLQFGGHVKDARAHDFPLKIPRWNHPPMDLLLVCEMIVANFFTAEWESFRDQPGWCSAIAISQRLCYRSYLAKLSQGLSVSTQTILNNVWAKTWI